MLACCWFQVAAISEQSSESEIGMHESSTMGTSTNVPKWKSFDMRSVVASTEDLFHFILSEKGRRVRVFLIQDILQASDAFMQEEALPCIFEEQGEKSYFEVLPN